MKPGGGNLYLSCNYCWWRDYNYLTTASITDIKPDITTLMAIHTRVTLTAIHSQHVIIQFDGLGALNEWILSHTDTTVINVTI